MSEYEDTANPLNSFPWLNTDNCHCNCSTHTEGATILQNLESATLDENVFEDGDVHVPLDVSGLSLYDEADEDSSDVILGNIALDSDESDIGEQILNSSSDEDDNDDEYYINDDEDNDLSITHTLPFKVIGVAHSLNTQNHLELCLERLTEEPDSVQVRVNPEPENEKDKNAISVQVNYSNEWNHVGYIASELTHYVHNALESNLLIECRIQHIKFRVHFYRPGFYMKLLITRQGEWEPLVLHKSKSVR